MSDSFSVQEVAKRLDSVFGALKDRPVVAELKQRVGYTTSYETVRRARKGLAKSLPHDLIAATAAAFNVNAGWLLTGEGRREKGGKEEPENHAPEGAVPLTYRGLFSQMERVLADTDTPAAERAYLLDTVVGGMRIAGLIEEGVIAKDRIRSLDGERGLAKQRQDVIDRAEGTARDRSRRYAPSPEAYAATGRSLDDIRDMMTMSGMREDEVAQMIQAVEDIRRRRDFA